MTDINDFDDNLIPAFRQGDQQAFTVFFRQYYRPLCFFAEQLLGSMSDAEDIVKDSYLKLWNKRTAFDQPQSIKSFLYTATRNASLNHLRHQKVKNNFQKEMHYLDDQKGDELVLQQMIRSELMRSIYQEIEKLPEKRQQVFRMIYFDGLKNEEIAEKLGISVFTVKEHKAKALAQLRMKFSDEQLMVFFIICGAAAFNI
ncbi:RNA polymerase sigma-70 factor [Pseudobacter ginsenosidimutans]|uniref:RNA polymerase sigma-70 factor (ECF subfamily) n=1 Tax=Pseudobacter ginsenosidimutans TaxID=661488 RepID=A0A4Q7MVG1_9BACT|nr:RNA polymerase sigma-70 factor [Pseudobacter ginsenosidimutans]QEC40623.1 RNA polymerase sigma-70 factor [Pseudobacter ginsenosidimutans]RZS72657.1 RNA polymerase sigma-70 factor (ECF subfamily) [Pseudobacter ginsenosidimutans]